MFWVAVEHVTAGRGHDTPTACEWCTARQNSTIEQARRLRRVKAPIPGCNRRRLRPSLPDCTSIHTHVHLHSPHRQY
ncbi:hypothetical protein AMELA_G00163320 [Ameiurus melas]|uniref:Uncharacterized protein n=1 Tax=Ameiurus melas TaxID=219545 RepID=A0A7J6AFB8_AMEME|nr:hypothetical protein AMELA_G00163320 [Ameiurus melas]